MNTKLPTHLSTFNFIFASTELPYIFRDHCISPWRPCIISAQKEISMATRFIMITGPSLCDGQQNLHGFRLDVVIFSLIPRPSIPPVFDCLQYAKTEEEGLGNHVT